MITVSLNPFSVKKLFLFVIAALGITCVSCFAETTLVNVKSTPYDNQMQRIRPILVSGSKAKGDVSLSLVNHWIGDLRSIPYGFTAEWKTPSETESGAPADCKAKAVALYEKMQAHGASNVRLVIGKRTPASRSTHAWLEWETKDGSYVLDPTINWMACRTAEVDARSYVPFYAFAGNSKYRSAGTTLLARN
jgi:hypothetical protein